MDAELLAQVQRAREGDLDAFCYVATAFRKQALAMARSVVTDPHRAEDAVQEALLSAFRKLPQLERPEAFPGWLATVVRREAIRRGRRGADLLEVPHTVPDATTPEPSASLEGAEVRAAVRDAVRTLRPKARDVIERFYLQGRSVEETARELGVPVGTVKRRLFEARQRLRSRLVGLAPLKPEQPRTPRSLRFPL